MYINTHTHIYVYEIYTKICTHEHTTFALDIYSCKYVLIDNQNIFVNNIFLLKNKNICKKCLMNLKN